MAKEYKAHWSRYFSIAITTWWWLGILTLGWWIVYSILITRNLRISVGEDSVTITSGAFAKSVKTISLKNVNSIEYNRFAKTVKIALVGSQTGYELESNISFSRIEHMDELVDDLRAAIKRAHSAK